MMNEYRIRPDGMMDLVAGLRQSARIARDEGMPHTAERCEELAQHMLNARDHMGEICPDGHHVELHLVFTVTPAVNPFAR